jgi:REP element-mobilizing transposase RayT
MPRQPRIEYQGAVYHVISRGDHDQAIVQDDTDRSRFLEALADACGKTGWLVHAYVLMDNHYHLLLETPEANLVAGMRWLQGTYANRHNRRHGVHGHLLQGRYKALIVDPEEDVYFLRLSEYIHLNPVWAGLIAVQKDGLEQYTWSSYPSYLRPKNQRPPWLYVDRVLAALDLGDTSGGRRAYGKHITKIAAEGLKQSQRDQLQKQWQQIQRGWCLGGERFRLRMQQRLRDLVGRHQKSSCTGPAVHDHDEKTASDLLTVGLEAVGLEKDKLQGTRKTDPRKQVVAWLLRKQTTVTNRWISRELNMGHEMNVSQAAGLVEKAERNTELDRLKIALSKRLGS